MKNQGAKVVLITGASSGIGEATAQRLSRAGYTVYAAARRLERMEGLKAQGVKAIKMDVTNEASMASGVDAVLNEAGRIDVLINNAGYGSYGALEDVPLAEGRYQFEVNLFGLVRLVQLVLPAMRRNGYGKIINISSIGGKIYEPLGGWYHATKFALEGLSDCLRMEVRDFGVDVVIIEPGGIKTEWAGIAAEKLRETSGHTNYGEFAGLSAGLLAAAETKASDPDVVARVIQKALTERRPRPRYTAGYGAGITLLMRRLLSDRGFDKFVLSFMKGLAKTARRTEA